VCGAEGDVRKTIRARVLEKADAAVDRWLTETPHEIWNPEIYEPLFPEWVAVVAELDIDGDDAISRYKRWHRVFHDHVQNEIARRVTKATDEKATFTFSLKSPVSPAEFAEILIALDTIHRELTGEPLTDLRARIGDGPATP
jgi:hypothetical protein